MLTTNKRIAKHIASQYYKEGVLYTLFKAGSAPRKQREGRLVPVFANPVSRYRNA